MLKRTNWSNNEQHTVPICWLNGKDLWLDFCLFTVLYPFAALYTNSDPQCLKLWVSWLFYRWMYSWYSPYWLAAPWGCFTLYYFFTLVYIDDSFEDGVMLVLLTTVVTVGECAKSKLEFVLNWDNLSATHWAVNLASASWSQHSSIVWRRLAIF